MLRSLFLQENCIKKIEGLENCTDLWNLNLSSNFIERIEGLSNCRKLNTLTIAKNKIGINGMHDVIELLDTNVSSVDIQDNKIWDPDVVPEVFMRMADLRVLYLKGNPCSKKIPNYRKSLTAYCTELRYLDDRPVFEEDRRASEAFNRGGLEEERAERRLIRQEKDEKHSRNMKAFNDMVQRAKSEKRERDAMRLEDKYTNETDPVVSQEQRMQQQVDRWKEENAEDLKDDAKESALKKMQSEKGQDVAGSTEPPPGGENELIAKAAEDNRKLIYEDIWDDDLPPAREPPAAEVPIAEVAANVGDSTREGHGVVGRGVAEAATSEVFLPWASGGNVAGMDAMPPSSETLEKRLAELRAKAKEAEKPQAGTEVGASGTPGWYSKYAEKAKEQQEAPASGTQPAPAPSGELDEMD